MSGAPSEGDVRSQTLGRQCGVCGAQVPPDHAFCGACGARMPESMAGEGDDGLINRVIDNRYRIVEKIGQGGMGAVFRAEHVGIGKQVAVKVVRADLRGNPELIRRFRREAMAVSRLTDAHTISVFDFGLWKGLAYLVMEYLTGTDLSKVLDNEGRLGAERALSIVLEMCSSLAEAHRVGLVHRDLKPENVFLAQIASGGTFVKVLDFGLAKMMGGKDLRTDPALFETQHGAIVGTPHYMAPEQIKGETVDGRADLYALGALLYRMLTGRLPYTAPTPMEVLQSHLKADLDPFSVAAPGVKYPPHVEALVRRLMSRQAADRPKSALELAQSIEELLAGRTPGWGAPPARPEGAPPIVSESGRLDTPWTARFDGVDEPLALGAALPEASAADERREDPFTGEPLVKEVDLATRGDFEAYEQRLKRRAWIKLLTLLVVLGGLGVGGWYMFWRPDPGELTREREPNDAQDQASLMASGVPITGYLGRRQVPEHSDWDLFRLPIEGGQGRLEIALTGVPNIDIMAEVYDREGRAIHRVNAEGVGEGEQAAALEVTGADVWIMIREVWVEGEAPKENSTEPYTLTVTVRPPAEIEPPEIEPPKIEPAEIEPPEPAR